MRRRAVREHTPDGPEETVLATYLCPYLLRTRHCVFQWGLRLCKQVQACSLRSPSEFLQKLLVGCSLLGTVPLRSERLLWDKRCSSFYLCCREASDSSLGNIIIPRRSRGWGRSSGKRPRSAIPNKNSTLHYTEGIPCAWSSASALPTQFTNPALGAYQVQGKGVPCCSGSDGMGNK